MKGSILFELSVSPTLGLASIVRHFVRDLHVRYVLDKDAAARIAMVTYELLENATRCSIDGATRTEITLEEQRLGTVDVVINISNRAGANDLAEVRSIFSDLSSAPDPFHYYMDAIRRAKRSTRSRLGLARIAAEAEMQLAYAVEGDVLSITAQAAIERLVQKETQQ